MKTFKIKDLGKVVGGSTPSTKIEEYFGGDISWITPKDLSGYQKKYICQGERNLTSKGFDSTSVKIVPKNTILFSSRAPIGYVAIAGKELCTNQGFKSIIPNDKINFMYLYYCIKYHTKNIEAIASGTSYKEVSGKEFSDFNIVIHDSLLEQKKVADTLSALDDKIELNNKINENLEKQAQAIFKHWFVDFEFPDENGNPYKSSGGEMIESELGMIPKGWEIFKLGNKIEVELGGTPARKNESYWGGNINWINSGELNSYRIFKETERITEEGLRNSSTKLWPKNTTVIAITGATLGKTSLLLIDTCANQSIVGIKESNEIPHTFIYPYVVSKIPKLSGQQTGGAQQHINKGNVEDLMLLLPNKDILKKYDNNIKKHYHLIEKNEFENIYLSKLRDTLLPKLMSGDIRIPLELEV